MSDLLVKIGADASEFNLTIDGLLSHIKDAVAEMDPVLGLAVAAVASIGIAAFESAESFDSAFNTIIAKTGAEGTQLDSLKQSFDTVFNAVPESAANVAEAISLVSDHLGLAGDALTQFTTQAAKLAEITGEQLQPQLQAVVQSLQNWSISSDDLAQKQNNLLGLSQQYGISVTALAQALAENGNAARVAGESYDQTAQRIAELSAQGISASTVYGALGIAQKKAEAAGLDYQVSLNDLIGTIQQHIEQGDVLSAAYSIMGRSANQFYELVKDGKLTIDSSSQSFQASTNLIDKQHDSIETLGRDMTDLKNAIMTLLAGPGGTLVEWLKDITVGVTDVVKGFSDLTSWLGKMGVGISSFAGPVGAVISLLHDYKAATDDSKTATVDLSTHLDTFTDAQIKAAGATASAKLSTVDLAAAEAGAKAVKEALTKAAADLQSANEQHASYLKATYIPAVLDVQTAEQNLHNAKLASMMADQAMQSTEQALADARKNSTGQVIALETTLATQVKASKDADAAYSDTVKELTIAKTNLSTVTKDVQGAEDAIAASERASYIPAILDHVTALESIDIAEANRVLAIQAVRDAEAALQAAQPQPGSPGDPVVIKAAEDALAQTKRDLAVATITRTQAVKDEKDSLSLLVSVQKDIDSTDKILLQNKRDLYPATTDLTKVVNDYETALAAAKVADDNLATAEGQLIAVRASGPTGQQLADALNNEKAAKEANKVATDNLAASTTTLTSTFNVNRDTLDLLKQHTLDYTASDVAAQVAMSNLGITSAAVLDSMATKADTEYRAIATSSASSDEEIRKAHATALQDRITADAAAGVTITAGQQLTLAKLTTQETDYQTESVTNWSSLYTTIDSDVKTFSDSAIKTLITGQGSFGTEFMTLMDNIAVSVVETFLKKATDAIASFIAGAITDILSGKGLGGVLDSLTKIGTSMTSVFSSASSIGASGTGAIGDTVSTGDTLAGVGGSASSGAGSVASGIVGSSLTGIVGAVGSVVSAISGVIGNFQAATTNEHLFTIMNDTARMEIYIGGNGDESIFGKTKGIWQYASEQKDFNFGTLHPDLVNMQVYQQLTNNYLTNIQDSAAALVLALAAPPIVNVTNNITLDGTVIASVIETKIEADVRAALA